MTAPTAAPTDLRLPDGWRFSCAACQHGGPTRQYPQHCREQHGGRDIPVAIIPPRPAVEVREAPPWKPTPANDRGRRRRAIPLGDPRRNFDA